MEREQERTESAGGSDGRRNVGRRPRGKRDDGEDRRRGGRRDAWSGDGNEEKVQGRRERNTVGDDVRGNKEERVESRETRGKEVE